MKDIETIYGIHASISALNNAERKIISFKCTKEVFNKIKDKILNERIPKFKLVKRKELDHELKINHHQGILVRATTINNKNFSIDEIISQKNNLVLILDGLTDSQNVGAIIRSAYLFGIKVIFYSENNSFDINSNLIKASSGSYEKVKLIKVVNLNNLVKTLKSNDYWIIGLDSKSNDLIESIPKNIYKAIIIGSENKGIKKLLRENCDFLVKIPMIENDREIDSLNVSNAASIIFYEMRN